MSNLFLFVFEENLVLHYRVSLRKANDMGKITRRCEVRPEEFRLALTEHVNCK